MKTVFKLIPINHYIAIKKHYCASVGSVDFYKMLSRRLKHFSPKELAAFLLRELEYHYKEFAQFQ